MDLPAGLGASLAAGLADLIASISGAPLPGLPYLAPALLFADPQVQARIGMPVAEPGDILVQDFQAVTYEADLPLDAPLQAFCERSQTADTTRFRFDVSAAGQISVTLDTALRCIERDQISGLSPTCFRNFEALGALALSSCLTFSQSDVARYVALSGDTNPIHSDPAEAAQLGLAAPIVPGLLLIATMQPSCAAALPELALKSLRARFMAPLCVGEPFRIALQMRATTAEGDLRVRATFGGENERALAVSDLVFAP
jgi:acyl dehydratase